MTFVPFPFAAKTLASSPRHKILDFIVGLKTKQKMMTPSSKGRIFVKFLGKLEIFESTSTEMLRRFSSMRDFNVNNDGDDGGRYSNKYQNPPEPIPNRPLRGERPFNHHNNQPQLSSQTHFNGTNRVRPKQSKVADDVPSNESFLEKFKFSVEKKAEKPSQNDAPAATQHKIEPPQDADEIFKKMKETGLIPNAVAMLDGLCKDGLVQEALKLFGLMREKGTIPEVVIYTAVVDGFCKAHKSDDAKRIFRKMQTNGIAPNAFSYGVLIQGLCNANELEDAIDYCIEMLEAGHSPNVTTFVGLVDGLCREKGVEEAQSAIATLKQKGFLVNDKAVREYLDRKAPFPSSVWEVIFGRNPQRNHFNFFPFS
ncbi:pentatricopeptide repeat-containing protein At4g38150-like [Mangifera indica]|uniref:pentatricopeptide repeat-containing protein At4g38150-like n=1 Tax=Mangifera indica TaxID=29780 RepID=UPI001CFBC1FC|nr:pentatricopeptide repeat-containing protein At4g38150-like [Mangifera indica]